MEWYRYVLLCLIFIYLGQKQIILAETTGDDYPTADRGIYHHPQKRQSTVNNQQPDRDNAGVNAAVNEVWQFVRTALEWLDDGFKPCEDFFNYVCHRSLARVNSESLLMEDVHRQSHRAFVLQQFLLDHDNEDLLNSELKLKYFYESCQNARSTSKLQSSLMYRLSGGGWPALEKSKDHHPTSSNHHLLLRQSKASLNSTWLESVSVFHEAGIEYIFQVQMKVISNQRVVQLRPREPMRFTLKKYEQMTRKLLQIYLPELNEDGIRLLSLEILHLERSLRDAMQTEMAGPINEKTIVSYQEFQRIWPHLHWDDYFRKVMGKPLQSHDQVIISELPRLQKLFNLLSFNVTQEQFLNWLWSDYLIDKMPEDCLTLTELFFGEIYEHIVQRAIFDRVHLVKMYERLSEMYDELLLHTFWIDEITQQRSQQFRERVTYLSLNGNSQLDTDYAALQITNRNFYRNLEKIQRFLKQMSRHQSLTSSRNVMMTTASSSVREFMRVVRLVSNVVGDKTQFNLSTPLNYILLGEQFSELMIGDGLMAWRSLDSEHHYNKLKKCIQRQQFPRPQMKQLETGADSILEMNNNNTDAFNFNEVLILKMLAHQQSWLAFERWLNTNQDQVSLLESRIHEFLLENSEKAISISNVRMFDLRQLYFIGTFLMDCQRHPFQERRDLLHIYLRNTPEFAQTFHCSAQQITLNARYKCKLL